MFRLRQTMPLILAACAATAAAQLPDYAAPQLQARGNLLGNDNGYNILPGSLFNSITADIDDSGRVAFPVTITPFGAPGLWWGGDGVGSTVFYGPENSNISSSLRLNNDAVAVFTLRDTGGADGIYRYDPAQQTATRVGTLPIVPANYSAVAVSNAGDIGFQANFSSGRGYAVRSAAGSSVLYVVDRSLDPGSAYTYLYTPNFDDARRIVAKVATSDDMVSATEIRRFAADGSSVRLAANRGTDGASPIRQFDNQPGVSDSGRVAFVAQRFADNRRAVYRIDEQGLTEIAAVDPTGPVREIAVFAPSINDDGLVAFRGSDANGQAVFVGDGVALRRVVGKGDRLVIDLGLAQIGQEVETSPVFAGAPALNQRGDVVFVAGLHPDGNNQIEWGTGVFVLPVLGRLFGDGFERSP